MESAHRHAAGNTWLRRAASVVIAATLAVITGWIAGVHVLVTFLPGGTPMVMNSALCMLVGGVGMLALAEGKTRVVAGCGLAVAVSGAVLLMQHYLDRSLGLDELFWRHQWVTPLTAPGRMAPNAAAAIVLVGISLILCASANQRHWLLPVMGGVTVAFALLPLLSYLATMVLLPEHGIYRGMAMPTVFCLLVSSIAILVHASAYLQTGAVAMQLLATALGMLLSIGIVAGQSNAELRAANQEVLRTYQVRSGIDHFVEEVARMENTMRGFALSGVELYRQRAAVHLAEVREKLAEAERLVGDNPDQLARIRRLHELAEQKFALNFAMMKARETSGVEEAAKTMTSQPMAVTSALVQVADEVHAEESRLLAAHVRERQAVERNSRAVQVLGGLFALGLLGGAVATARHASAARRSAEESLGQSQQMFQRLFEGSPDAIVLVGRDGVIVGANAQAETLFDWPRGTMAGAELSLLLPDRYRTPHRGLVEGYFRNPRMRELNAGRNLIAQRRDGSEFAVEVLINPVETGHGTQALAVVRDITSRKRAEEALRESEERFRMLSAAAFEGVVISEEGRIVDTNDRALAMLGYERADFVGRPVLDFVAPDSRHAVLSAITAGRESVYEQQLVRRDGAVMFAEASARMIRSGQRTLRLTALRDITARKQIESDLLTARDAAIATLKLKSDFMATVSHEIRTPMNGILGMANLLYDTKLDDEQKVMTRVIQSSAENLLLIINDILDFSKIEAGKLRFESIDFDLCDVVKETLMLLTPRAEEKKLRLLTEIPHGPACRFKGDAGRIRQVLTNLVGNAIKFTESGHVCIRGSMRSDSPAHAVVRFEIEDTGVGVPMEAQERIFEPFTQADGSTTRRFGGTGLGLAISRQLVSLMGGQVGFTSMPGKGSTFWFELPLTRVAVERSGHTASPVPVAAALPARSAPEAPAMKPSGPQLLLVDDNPSNQLVAQMLLEKMGYSVVIAENGQDALEKLGAGRFAAVLMDCRMPVLDGYETTRRLRAGTVPGADPNIPVIALTAHAMADDRSKCLAAGMDDYLTKPLRREELRSMLARHGLGIPETASEHDVLNGSLIDMVRGLPGRNGPSLWPELVDLYRREEPKYLADIEACALARNGEGLAVAAHKLAGSCGSLGAMELNASALAVEQFARKGDWIGIETSLGWLRTASERLHQALQSTQVSLK